ncbi:unnamed protein product [Didymodactylos carnosus]|uniref:ISXO2-like transposase domain-containing protein n=1 Tax=Didymodactylos carnosus TaxID=1234261 RepID=A0A814HS91_9BILA|nr:unnamed protein product [Didymodactylos carnosus]CAF3786775.1 unnamed protein product [Didymodactylos carnosus]
MAITTDNQEFYKILNDDNLLSEFVRDQNSAQKSEDHTCHCGSSMVDGARKKKLEDGTVKVYPTMRCTNRQCRNQLSVRKNTFFSFTDEQKFPNVHNGLVQYSSSSSSDDSDSSSDQTQANNNRNYGDRLDGPWIFGIAQPTAEGYEARFFHVQRCDAATLLPIIWKNVYPGTTIWSDEWKAYSRLQTTYGYDHQTVNHSQNFIDPHTGCHTQLIETLWGCENKNFKNYARNHFIRLTSGRILVSFCT